MRSGIAAGEGIYVRMSGFAEARAVRRREQTAFDAEGAISAQGGRGRGAVGRRSLPVDDRFVDTSWRMDRDVAAP